MEDKKPKSVDDVPFKYRMALYLADNTTAYTKDISIEMSSADEDVKTLLKYVDEVIEKYGGNKKWQKMIR